MQVCVRELASIFQSVEAASLRGWWLLLRGQGREPGLPANPPAASTQASQLCICSISEKSPARRLSAHRRSLEPGAGSGGAGVGSAAPPRWLSGSKAKSLLHLARTRVYRNACLTPNLRPRLPFFPGSKQMGEAVSTPRPCAVHSGARQYGAVHSLPSTPKILQTSGSRVGRNVVHSRFPLQTINLNKPLRIFKAFASGSGAHSPGPHLRGPRRSGRLFLSALHISSRMTRELQRVLHSGVVSSLRAGGSLQPALLTLIPTNFAAEPSQRGKWVRRVLHGEQRGQTAGAKKPAGFAPTPISPRLRPFCQRSKEVAAALPCSAVLGKQRKWAG